MKQTDAVIERIRRVNDQYQHLELAVDESLHRLRPGHTLLVRVEDTWQPYLREHWWPVDTDGKKLVVERPAHFDYTPGQIVDVIAPVGQPFRFRRTLRTVLLMAYDNPPTPLLLTIPWLLNNKVGVTLALLGTARNYGTQHIPPEVEVVHADDDLTWPDQVMTFGWADQLFITVSQEDELEHFSAIFNMIQSNRADITKNYAFGVFQSILPCGMGACHACTLQTRSGLRLICTDGPAFDLTQVTLP